MFEIFKLIYFKKLPIKKVLIKLRVLSDASVLIKCWFNKQAPQKVLIELSPGMRCIRQSCNTKDLPELGFLYIPPVPVST